MLLNPIKKSNKIFALLLAVVLVVSSLSVSCFAVTDAERQSMKRKLKSFRNKLKKIKRKLRKQRRRLLFMMTM